MKKEIKKKKKAKRKSSKEDTHRLVMRQHYQRAHWAVLQHYSKSEVPSCKKCGCPHIKELHLHHTKDSGKKLRRKAGFAPTASLPYWKWLIAHHYPRKHDQTVLCSTCHWLTHATITKSLIGKVNWRLRMYSGLPETPVPIWFVKLLEERGYKVIKKLYGFDEDCIGYKEWWEAEPPIRWKQLKIDEQ